MSDQKSKDFVALAIVLAVINIALAVVIAGSGSTKESNTPGVEENTYFIDSTPIPEFDGSIPEIDESEWDETEPPEDEEPFFDETNPLEDEDPYSDENEPQEREDIVQEETEQPGETSVVLPQETVYREVLKDPEGKRPDYYDFDWYFNDVQHNGMWSDAKEITDLGKVLGDWKAYILHDPQKTTDNSCEMLFNLDITVGESGVELLCDWYYILYFSSEKVEYQENDSHFKGTWNNGTISASGPGTMNLNGFYERDGVLYGLGEMKAKDGTPAIIVLVRP